MEQWASLSGICRWSRAISGRAGRYYYQDDRRHRDSVHGASLHDKREWQYYDSKIYNSLIYIRILVQRFDILSSLSLYFGLMIIKQIL